MKIIKFLVKAALLGSLILTSCQERIPNVKLKTEKDSVCYALGINIGTSCSHDLEGFLNSINNEAVIEGFARGFNGDTVNYKMNADTINIFLQSYFNKLKEQQKAETELENAKLLYENRQKEGVKVTESGLQYKVITEGKGAIPVKNDTVKVHYTGKFADGQIFDSSVRRGQPMAFAVDEVIAGWTEALLMMPVGSKWELVIPANLAYGERGFRSVPPNTVLFFEMELLDIIKPKNKK